MLSCAGADRLQTGMRDAFGKPQGVCARVKIGQILMSVRCKKGHIPTAVEAFRRAKFKFPGRQKIVVSKKWGFTKYTEKEYLELRASGKLIPDGNQVKYIPDHGPLKYHFALTFLSGFCFGWLLKDNPDYVKVFADGAYSSVGPVDAIVGKKLQKMERYTTFGNKLDISDLAFIIFISYND